MGVERKWANLRELDLIHLMWILWAKGPVSDLYDDDRAFQTFVFFVYIPQ